MKLTLSRSSTSVAGIAAVTALMLALAGCSSSADSSAGATTAAASQAAGGTDSGGASADLADCATTMIPKTTDNPYFAAVKFGADAAAAEIGAPAVDFVGTAQTDAQGQIQRVQAATTQNACVINIAAVDAEALTPALKAAKDAGINVVTYDADVDPSARTLFINQVDATDLGVTMVKLLAEGMNFEGDFAILSAQSTAQNQNAWIAAMQEELKKPEYAKMKLVKIVYGDDDFKKSYDAAVSLMNAYPDLDGILSPEPAGLEGSVKARDDLKFNPNLVLTGLGWPPGDASLLKDGKVKSFVLWSPVDLGYLTYYANAALASGKITGAEGETFDAGKLGTKTIGANGVVVLGDPVVYTSENVDAGLEGFRTE